MLLWCKLVYIVILSCKNKKQKKLLSALQHATASRLAALIGGKVTLKLLFLSGILAQAGLEPFSSCLVQFSRCTCSLWLGRLWTTSVELCCVFGVIVAGIEIYSQVVLLYQTDCGCSSTLVMFSASVFPSAVTSSPGPAAENVRQTYRLVWRPKSSMFVCKDLLPSGLGLSLFPDPHLDCTWTQIHWDHRAPDQFTTETVSRYCSASSVGNRPFSSA